MDEVSLVTRPAPSGIVRWTSNANRPPALFLLLLLLLVLAAIVAGPASGATVSGYREEIRLERDGSAAVTLAVGVSGAPGETVRLPFGHAKADLATLRVRGAASARVETLDGGLPVLVVLLPPVPSPLEVLVTVPRLVDFSKTMPFGNRVFVHQLANATQLSCGKYEGTYLLPAGFRVNSVVETTPPESESSATEPFDVVRVDGRDGLRLVKPRFDPADRVAATFRFKPAGRSPVLLGLLVVAGVLYLFRFRDLVGGAR